MSVPATLELLMQTMHKSHVKVQILPVHALECGVWQSIRDAVPGLFPQTSAPPLPSPVARFRYHLTDSHGFCYIYFLLDEPDVLLIGPYLQKPMTDLHMLELGEHLGISPKGIQRLLEYVSAVPILERESALFLLLDSFCEQLWHSPAFTIVDVNQPPEHSPSLIHRPLHTDRFDDVLLDMKAMEQRYAFENELIRAVSLGQLHVESQLFATVSDQQFERRVADPLRNNKNYCIIMNTLLRKAAESGGVHPLYIDRVSSDFARRIEQMTSLSQSPQMMQEIFRGYCLLVQQHALRSYSKVVQTTILLIDSDLAADLSLHALAKNQGISPGYLSTVFRQETGKTVTAYIREKRMRHACHLLGTTNLQIQTVAMHCGILDVHYFSKIFKAEVGMTPKQYREHVINTANGGI